MAAARSDQGRMKKAVAARLILSAVLLVAESVLLCAETKPAVNILPLDQVKPGMHGVAYTVFEGVQPEAMDVEILGVLRNANGPKGDIILTRLHGKKVEYTGVVAGMSGSPVYVDGKLVGAIAFRIGEFSKEPIAGVTPIQEMLEINALDASPAAETQPVNTAAKNETTKTSGPGVAGLPQFANLLTPIETP